MGFSIKWVIIRRFVELTALEFLMSFIVTSLNVFGILTESPDVFVCLTMCVLIFLCVNLVLLRKCFFDIDYNNTIYYTSNYAAYLLFALTNVLLYKIFPSELYTWLIGIVKFAKFSSRNISVLRSMLFFLGSGMILILIAPLGMGRGNGRHRRIRNVF